MPESVSSTRIQVSPLVRRERRKELFLYISLFFCLALIVYLASMVQSQNVQLRQKSEGLYRTQQELINGGKRFIDYYWSLNSSTVQLDQFRASQMIVNEKKKEEHKKYIERTGLVKEAQLSNMHSEIDWWNTKADVIDETDEYIKIEYQGYLKVNKTQAMPFDMILFLVPVPKTDFNTDGVGVIDFIDVAEDPFKEGK